MKKRKWVLTLIALVVVLGIMTGAAYKIEDALLPTVVVQNPANMPLRSLYPATGTLDYTDKLTMLAPLPLKITAIHVAQGQRVYLQTPVLTVDTDALERALITLKLEKARLEEASNALTTRASKAETDMLNAQRLNLELADVSARVAQGEALVRAQGVVYAEATGFVLSLGADAGGAIAAGAPLCTIVKNPSDASITFTLSAEAAGLLDIGDTIEAYLHGQRRAEPEDEGTYPISDFRAVTIVEKHPVPHTATVRFVAALPADTFMTHMYAIDMAQDAPVAVEAHIVSLPYEYVLPRGAVTILGDRAITLLRLEEDQNLPKGCFRVRLVTTFLSGTGDTQVAVQAPFSQSYRVVISSSAPIADGDIVKVG